jgi:hypothetical protein
MYNKGSFAHRARAFGVRIKRSTFKIKIKTNSLNPGPSGGLREVRNDPLPSQAADFCIKIDF